MWFLPSVSCLIWVAVLSISSASASILALHSDSTACTFLVHCSTIKHRRFTLQQVHYFLMLSLTYLILNILSKKKTNALAQESKVWQTAKLFNEKCKIECKSYPQLFVWFVVYPLPVPRFLHCIVLQSNIEDLH